MGQVTHTLSALRDGISQLNFDSVDLNISAVQVDGKDAHFSTDAEKLRVDLIRAEQGRPEIRSPDSLRRQTEEGPVFHSAGQEPPESDQADLVAGRS